MRTYGSSNDLMRQLIMSTEWDSVDEDEFECNCENQQSCRCEFEQLIENNQFDSSSCSTSDSSSSSGDDNGVIEVEEKNQNSAEKVVAQRLNNENKNSCSICWEEFEDEQERNETLIQLQCNHNFCKDCIRQYIDNETKDVTKVVHKVCIVEQIENSFAPAIEISYEWRPSLQCPGFQCLNLISEKLIESILIDKSIWRRFQRFANARIDMMIAIANKEAENSPKTANGTSMAINEFGIRQCRRCETFAVLPGRRGRLRCKACLIPFCGQCEQSHTIAEGCVDDPVKFQKRHTVDQLFIACLQKNAAQSLVRNCPHCNVIIEKNGGCPSMYCTHCKKGFYWYNTKFDPSKTYASNVKGVRVWKRRAKQVDVSQLPSILI